MVLKADGDSKAKMNLYTKNMHGVQTGIMYLREWERQNQLDAEGETSPKHLRVGVNSALIESAALQELLIEKGILTLAEVLDKLVEYSAREKEMYERKLTEKYGRKVTLG